MTFFARLTLLGDMAKTGLTVAEHLRRQLAPGGTLSHFVVASSM
jgi:hypothetical protein